ncbi:MAG: sulfurtransferase [Piscirickettsiaceae bacterium]|nr:MAG: sulfurtransferase [Piscirickettsiaceae bacterium]PCI71571.1 MAG: sulfurtransferase [Piscirickettsiaceae bacterium]
MIKPASEFIAEAQKNIKCINPSQAKNMLNYNDSLIVIDVREPAETLEGNLNCSINIPRGLLEMKTPEHCPNHETTILVHCAAGGRASLAAVRLNEMGYKNVYAITAKFEDIKKTLD